MNLSPHFTLEELTASQTAARLYLRNNATGRPLVNLGRLANFLEDVRAVLGVPNAGAVKWSRRLRHPVSGSTN
jgi:zinc D-Ala-D-Ala carboxypeptidase